MDHNRNQEQGAKPTAVEAEVPKTGALERNFGAPCSAKLLDHVANRVPGNYTSLKNNSR